MLRPLLAVLLVATACAGSPGAVSPTTVTTPAEVADPGAELLDPAPRVVDDRCPMVLPDDALNRVRCYRLVVPLDRSDPAAGDAEVAVAVLGSLRAEPAPDAVVFVHGGPGGAALLDTAAWLDPATPLLADRDLVLVDHRGAGYSRPSLDCPEVAESPDGDADLDAHRACRDRLDSAGVPLDRFTTADIAQDLADLRSALGYRSWNVYAVSYGTRVALRLLAVDPGGLRSVVLDSVYPPQVDAYAEQAARGAEAIRGVLDACAADPACAQDHPAADTALATVLERLDRHPESVTYADPATGEEVTETLDDESFAYAVFLALYDAARIAEVPGAIEQAADGDLASAMARLTGSAPTGAAAPRLVDAADTDDEERLVDSEGAYWAGECADEVPSADLDAAQVQVAADPLGRALVSDVLDAEAVCAVWDVAVAEGANDPVEPSKVPALVLAGEFDPITPADWGRTVATTLGDARFVLVRGHGHVPSFDLGCPEELVAAFVADPVGRLDTSCAAETTLSFTP